MSGLPVRPVGGRVHQQRRPWPRDYYDVTVPAAVATVYVPDDSRARSRRRVLAQLDEGRRRRAAYWDQR